MPSVIDQGVRIHYQVEGNGPTLVLLAGLFQSIEVWYEHGYVEQLKDLYQLILIDLPGHGQSGKPETSDQYAFKRFTDAVIAVLDELDIERAHILGFSFGGWVLHGLSVFWPDRVLSSLSLDGFPGPDDAMGVHEYVTKDTELSEDERVSRLVLAKWVAAEIDEILAQVDVALDQMTEPYLFLSSDWPADTAEVAFGNKAKKTVQNITYHAFEGFGHLDLLTRSEETIPQIQQFLAGVP